MNVRLMRRTVAELLGTGLLVTAVVGSGIAAARLSPDEVGLQLLENSIATGLALGALILIFGPVSGAHFNPVVSAADWWLGRRAGTGLRPVELGWYVGAQVVGGIGGAMLANVMFDLTPVFWSNTDRSAGHLWLGEVVATAGLMLLVFALARSGRATVAPAAVGAYIGAAYWFTSSTSFANPAVTIGRTFSDTFAGIAPASLAGFIVAQLVGAAAGVGLVAGLYPGVAKVAADVVVPHDDEMTGDKPSVLFVCVHNAGRSQMAAGWLRHLAGDAVEVRSAGSEPGDEINPVAVQAMAEVGIDITAGTPRKLNWDLAQGSDAIITMGCGDACPVFPGKRYEDWTLTDPAGQSIEMVRQVRDDIRRRVEKLLAELLPATG